MVLLDLCHAKSEGFVGKYQKVIFAICEKSADLIAICNNSAKKKDVPEAAGGDKHQEFLRDGHTGVGEEGAGKTYPLYASASDYQ